MTKPSAQRMRRCHEGKRQFATLQEARTACAAMARKKAAKGSPIVSHMSAYGCACGGFHFGRDRRGINWDLVAKHSKPKKPAADTTPPK